MKKTVLIFGISSFVGSNLAQYLKDDYRIIGTYYKTPVSVPGVLTLPCDVLKKEYVYGLVSRFKPDITIYAVGMSDLSECKLHPKQAESLNSSGAVNCCLATEREGAKFIYLSSSFVVAGADQLYREGDLPMPNTIYGQTVSSSEFYIQRSCLNYFILRCSPLYGRGHRPLHPTWFEKIQSAFYHHKPIELDDSFVTGFLDIYLIAKILKAVINSDLTNRLFQVSSRDFMTRYEFGKLYAKVFREDEGLIHKSSLQLSAETSTQKNSSKGPTNTFFKLDTYNISEFIGTGLPSVEDSLQVTYRLLKNV